MEARFQIQSLVISTNVASAPEDLAVLWQLAVLNAVPNNLEAQQGTARTAIRTCSGTGHGPDIYINDRIRELTH